MTDPVLSLLSNFTTTFSSYSGGFPLTGWEGGAVTLSPCTSMLAWEQQCSREEKALVQPSLCQTGNLWKIQGLRNSLSGFRIVIPLVLTYRLH